MEQNSNELHFDFPQQPSLGHPIVTLLDPALSSQALFLDLVLFLPLFRAASGMQMVRSSGNLDTSSRVMLSRIIGRRIYVVELSCEDRGVAVVLASAQPGMIRDQYYHACHAVLDDLLNEFNRTFIKRAALNLHSEDFCQLSESTFRAAVDLASRTILP